MEGLFAVLLAGKLHARNQPTAQSRQCQARTASLVDDACLLPEDLLQAPAYRVRQLENGLIEMLVYSHPLEYDLPENRQRIIELTRYFAAKRRQ